MTIRPTRGAQRPPAGLTKASRGLWRDLHEKNTFAAHEEPLLERALRFWDLSARLLREADAAEPGLRQKLLKLGFDAHASALRSWRLLRFVDPAKRARLGRPPVAGFAQVIAQEGNGRAHL